VPVGTRRIDALERAEGFLRSAHSGEQRRPLKERRVVVRIDGERFVDLGKRLLRLAGCGEDQAEDHVALVVHGLDAKGGIDGLPRVHEIVLLEVEERERYLW